MRLSPLLVDTDMAMDDWIALLYLLGQPEVDLRAITIAGTGEAHGYFGRRNALRLLALTETNHITVATGRAEPLGHGHSFPLLVRLAMDFRLGLSLPSPIKQRIDPGAVALLTQQLQQSDERVTILTLGPLTNLAEVLRNTPHLVNKIGMIYIMGGALEVAGNLGELLWRPPNRYAEWNFYADPQAVVLVFHSGAPITLIPLDVTNQYPLTDRFYQSILQSVKGKAGGFLVRLLRRIRRLSAGRTFYFWDPLAAVVATYPTIATFEEQKIRIIAENGSDCGRLITDKGGTSMLVCKSVSPASFEYLLLQSFCSA